MALVISSNVDLSLTVQLKALAVVQRRNEVDSQNPDVLKRRKQEAIQRRVEESLAGSDCNKGEGVF